MLDVWAIGVSSLIGVLGTLPGVLGERISHLRDVEQQDGGRGGACLPELDGVLHRTWGRVARDAAPCAVQDSVEFREACPASATVLLLHVAQMGDPLPQYTR